MKKLVVFIFAVSFCMGLKAQDTSFNSSIYQHQLGLNGTEFIKQFLILNNNNLPNNSPYLLTYKYITDGVGLRTGLGGTMTNSSRNPNNGTPSISTQGMTINFRIGFESQYTLGKRWLYYVGFDAFYDYSLSRTKTSSTSGFPPKTTEITSGTESFGVGAGPVLGIQFMLGKRISFNAESNAYYRYSENRVSQTNPQFPQFSTNEFTSRNALGITIPTNLFFIIHF